MAKIDLNTVSSGYLSQAALNANFTAIENEFQNKVLYRDNPSGEPNSMQSNLDMNGYYVLNAGNTSLMDADNIAYTQNGTGAKTRTIAEKLNDVVSVKDFGAVGDGVTDDTAAIQAAVTACVASGEQLFWPVGTYVTTSSINNLHNVRHLGDGGILRGAVTFYVNPSRTQTNTLYVATTGTAANDGLGASQPMTPQTACNALRVYGNFLEGTWCISLAAGTYVRDTLFLPTSIHSRNEILVFGPATGDFRSTPTAIFDGSSQSGTCIAVSLAHRVKFKDIKIVNWCNGSPSFNSGGFNGVAIDISGDLTASFENIHIDNCDCGLYAKSGASYFYKGGIIQNCGAGVQELFSVVRDFKIAGATGSRTTIQSCEYGLKAKELCTGHLDYLELLDNTYGVHFSRACTGNLTNAILSRNTVGVYGMAGSSFVDLSVTWGSGVDANGVKFSLDASSAEIGRNGGENSQAALFQGKGSKLVGNDVTSLTITGTTSDTLAASFNSTVEGDFQAIGEFYEGLAYGTAILASTASIRFRVGGNGASLLTMPTGTYSWALRWRFTATGADAQLAFAELQTNAGSSAMAINARAYAFSSSAFLLGLYVQLGATGDSVTVLGAHLCTSEM